MIETWRMFDRALYYRIQSIFMQLQYSICHGNIFSLLLSQTNLHFNKLCVKHGFVHDVVREVCIHSLLDLAVGLKFFATGADLQHADKRA